MTYKFYHCLRGEEQIPKGNKNDPLMLSLRDEINSVKVKTKHVNEENITVTLIFDAQCF